MIMRISMPNRFRLKKVMGFRTMIRPERGEIHYIGGADILPAPLSLKEETEALNKFGTEEEKEAKSELIEHNLRLVVYIAKKFDNTSVGVEDLISIGTIGLIKAVVTFNPDKGNRLAAYASRCIENAILSPMGFYSREKSPSKDCSHIGRYLQSFQMKIISCAEQKTALYSTLLCASIHSG